MSLTAEVEDLADNPVEAPVPVSTWTYPAWTQVGSRFEVPINSPTSPLLQPSLALTSADVPWVAWAGLDDDPGAFAKGHRTLEPMLAVRPDGLPRVAWTETNSIVSSSGGIHVAAFEEGAWRLMGAELTGVDDGGTTPTPPLLNSGKVLVAGGDNLAGPLSSSELFDPATGSWASAASMASGRRQHSSTLLLSGQVLVSGGSNGDIFVPSAELYTP